MTQSNKPVKVYHIGLVSCSIFCNEGESKLFHSVQLHRRYKDGDDWKSSTALSLSDLPTAQKLLGLAFDYVAEQEADVTP